MNAKHLTAAALAALTLAGCADMQVLADRGTSALEAATAALTTAEPAERRLLVTVSQADERAFQAADAAAKAFPGAGAACGATTDTVSFTSAGRTWPAVKRYQLILCDIPAGPLAARDPAALEFAKAMATYASNRNEATKFGIVATKADAAFLESAVAPILKARGVKLETTVVTKGPYRLAFMSTGPTVRRVQ